MSQPASRLYLWRKRTLYLGPIRGPLQLQTAAARLLVGLEGPITVRPRDQLRSIPCRSVVVPVGYRAVVETGGGMMADCHLDVTGFDQALLARVAEGHFHGLHYNLTLPDDLPGAMAEIYHQPPAPDILAVRLEELLNPPTLVAQVPFSLDPRIRATIDLIQASAGDNLPLSALAQQVNLSNSRLVNLFKSQVGIPVRRYRLWHRIFRACCWLAEGDSLTEAAVHAGFSDGAHLTRTFRDILGIRPSDLFSRHRLMEVYVEPVARLTSDS